MALQRRLPPSHPLRLELATDGGFVDIREFKLCLDLNAAALIKEKTDVSLLNFVEAWTKIGDPRLLRVMFWAAVLAHHPEYNDPEGLETIGSLVDETVSEQVAEALWQTYLKSLSKSKREAVLELRKKAEELGKDNGRPPEPSGNSGTPAPVTAIPTATNGSNSTQSQDTSELELTNSAK
jgi:hypothetical protein